jgi:hypothetical protein
MCPQAKLHYRAAGLVVAGQKKGMVLEAPVAGKRLIDITLIRKSNTDTA